MKYILYFIFLFSAEGLIAQTSGDTAIHQPIKKVKPPIVKKDMARLAHVAVTDSIQKKADTAVAAQVASPFKASGKGFSYRETLAINPYFSFFAPPEDRYAEERRSPTKDSLFYILAGLLFFFALIKLLFNRYVNNLLGLIFRGALRQKQIREQLLQTPLPSLLLNIFFVMVWGLYIFFLLQYYKVSPVTPFWLSLLYCIAAVAMVYLVKFMILKLTGWIFNMRDAADTYMFIVFLVNKLLAIFLLPLLIVMVFSLSSWSNVLLTLSYIMVILFFAYRYIVSFGPVRREVKVSQFHFFMYLCAFEIIPLLLIYKVLLSFF
ncbi:MAG: DUF4271 domain-containing protein [Bacteroidota bacterium]